MRKDKNRANLFYWECAKRSHKKEKAVTCSSRASTELKDNQHYLINMSNHSHSPEASDAIKLYYKQSLREKGENSDDKPCKVISTAKANVIPLAHHKLPTPEASRKIIKRRRVDGCFKQPTKLENLVFPDKYHVTISGKKFLMKVISEGEIKIWIFTTEENLQVLGMSFIFISECYMN